MKKGNLSINEFILKMRTTADDLSSTGSLIGDDDLILYILGSLGA